MTPTLESALSGLPAKPRVHELSKRIGISNKELLAALADRGLTISSASASVPLAIAQQVIEALLGGMVAADDEAGDGAAAETDATGSSDGAPVAADRPGDTPGSAGHAINPLFLPPAAAEQFAVEHDQAVPERDSAGSDEEPAPARTGSARRRRGRSGGGRRPTPDAETEMPASAEAVLSEDAQQPAGQDQPNLESAVTPDGDLPADTDQRAEDADGDDDSSARGRRRRRGRRGRGRVSDTDDRPDGRASDAAAADSSADADASTSTSTTADEQAGQSEQSNDDSEDDDSDTEAATEADTDGDEGGTGGNRRRRRRRRRSTGEETPREDDPDNTVVHVREPRLSQAGASSPGGSAAGPSDVVQGVRGSTRLEAKRQRRRDSRDSSRRRPQILTEAEFLARRESVERVMAVRQRGDLAQVALLEDGILVEHFVSQTGSDSMIGSVFLGKVQNVLPSMEAAFVDIGRGRNAVIYAGEVNWDAAGLNGKARRIETALSSGDTILAQVSKDPVGHKGARLTTQISLPGRFLVYVPAGGATGISRKLPDTERKRLKSILDRIVPDDAGVIIRTAAEGIAEDELARDVERLKSQWEEITRRASEKTSAPTQLYAEPGTLIKVVRDLFNSDITRLVVDGDEAYGPVADYVTSVAPELADRLVRYEGNSPNGPDVFAAYRIDEQIAKALERKVHLPSGGSLVIDRTEAMTVVDVNTGKYTGSGGNLEETVTKNNLEAAEEMVRQLRLRDIGGIIVIDFIDMVLESNRELVLRRLTEALGRDRTRHQVAEVTSLGLVQMTRKRMGTGLVEAFSAPCPHCGGRGLVLHDLPVVASAFEDAGPERRSGKTRRGRGRDTDRADEVVVPRVVEVPAGRRPDPRGPKPPPRGGGSEPEPTARGETIVDDGLGSSGVGGRGADGGGVDGAGVSGAGVSGAGASGGGVGGGGVGAGDVALGGDAAGDRAAGVGRTEMPSDSQPAQFDAAGGVDAGGSDADLDGIEAAASAGIKAAQDADEDAFEGQPSSERPERRRRGRRSAGRPAGAPTAVQPVDSGSEPAVASERAGGSEAPTDAFASTDAPVSPDAQGPPDALVSPDAQGSPDEHSSADGHSSADAQSYADGQRNGHSSADPDESGAAPTAATASAPAAPQRRRRAASRPAGPAAGVSNGEPMVMSVPVQQPAS